MKQLYSSLTDNEWADNAAAHLVDIKSSMTQMDSPAYLHALAAIAYSNLAIAESIMRTHKKV